MTPPENPELSLLGATAGAVAADPLAAGKAMKISVSLSHLKAIASAVVIIEIAS